MKKSDGTKKVVMIGAGNVATHLALAIGKTDHTIEQVYSRSEKSAKMLASKCHCDYTTQISKLSPDGDIYIIAIKDDFVEGLIEKIDPTLRSKFFVHTSGSLDITIFEKKFSVHGVLYPLQTFSKQRLFRFKNIPVCIEANTQANANKLYDFATAISDHVHFVDSEKRKKLHLAAVFACNFTNHLYAIAARILKESKLPFELLIPLIEETAAKAIKLGPSKAQTGPALRGDHKILNMHLKMLSSSPDLKMIYNIMSKEIEKDKE